MTTLAKLLVGLGLDASEYDKGLDQAETKASGFGSKIGGFLGSAMKMGLAATAGGVIAAIGGIVKGVASNAEFERYETQFGVLLGSTEKAKERLADLAKFGAQTPFELPEVVNADKILQGFGLHSEEAAKKFGFSGAQIRTIAGDVASGTGSSFEEMSLLLGKFSAGATGEAISRMAELGIASRADLAKMGLEFDKSGALLSPLPKAMNVVLQMMQQKYGGMMQAQSATFEGMISNLQDWVSGTLRTLSAPIFEVVKDKLGVLLAFLSAPETQAALTSFADNLASGIGAAIDFISTTVIPAFQSAWTNLQPTIQTVVGLITQLVSTAQGIIASFANAGTSATGLQGILTNVFGADLTNAIMNFAAWLQVRVPQALQATRDFAVNVLIPGLQGVWSFVSKYIIPVLGVLAAAFLTGLPIAIDAVVAFINSPLIPAFIAIYNFVQANIIPILQQVVTWLAINLPPAISSASDFFNNTLLPALNAVWSFINTYVIPIIVALVTTHIAALKAAIQVLSNFWTNTLLPALQAVWSFLNAYIIPIIKALVNVNIAALSLALRMLAAVWQNVILPALQAAWNYINTYIVPIFVRLYDEVINRGFKPALESVAFFILGTLNPMFMAVVAAIDSHLKPAFETGQSAANGIRDAFNYISSAVQKAIEWINKVADALNSIQVPDWLQGHSPPPMANWFGAIGQSALDAGNMLNQFHTQALTANTAVAQLSAGLNNLNSSINLDAAVNQRDNRGNSSIANRLRDTASQNSSGGLNLNITGNYRHQDERTLRDEIRMQAMLNNINPTG